MADVLRRRYDLGHDLVNKPPTGQADPLSQADDVEWVKSLHAGKLPLVRAEWRAINGAKSCSFDKPEHCVQHRSTDAMTERVQGQAE